MGNLIVIPDLHGRKFWRKAIEGHENDKIIFLGDYVDPYPWEKIGGNQAYSELVDIIAFKRDHPNNVVLLLGNHDLGYLDDKICDCRKDYFREEDIRALLLENLTFFDIIHIEEVNGVKMLFSHAGIAEEWVEKHKDLWGGNPFEPIILNEMFHNENSRPALFAALADVSSYRGGEDEVGSPVWVDVMEFFDGKHLTDGYLHVFGHSLHEGDGIDVGDQGICLDCCKAFVLKID